MAASINASPFRLFLSFDQGNDLADQITKALVDWFKGWNIDAIRAKEGQDVDYERQIMRQIEASDLFVQIVTPGSDNRPWVTKELNWAEHSRRQTNVKPSDFVFLLTKDISEKWIPPSGLPATPKVFKIQDRGDAERFLKAALGQALRTPIGAIQLPLVCRPEDEVNFGFEELHEFLRNFYDGYKKGLMAVYSDRQQGAARTRLRARMGQLAKEGGLVRMTGFTLSGYVLAPERNEQAEICGDVFQEALNHPSTRACLMLLDVTSPAAVERRRFESPRGEDDAILFRDSRRVCAKFPSDSAHVMVKFYQSPYIGLVLFEDLVFVEIYHLGTEGGSKTAEKGICGQAPYLVFGTKGDGEVCMYTLFSSHFDNLWNALPPRAGHGARSA